MEQAEDRDRGPDRWIEETVAMRVLVVQNFYDDFPIGGAELLCRDIVAGLKGLGHEIRVLSTNRGRSAYAGSELPFLKCFPWASDAREFKKISSKLKWASTSRRNYSITEGVIRDFSPSVIYLHNLEWVTASPLLASVESGKKIVLHAHNHQYLELWKSVKAATTRAALHKLFKMIPGMGDAKVIAISRFIADELLSEGFPGDRVKVIYNGLPEDILKKSDSALPRQKKAVFVGSLSPHKGVHVAIEAIGILKNKGFHLPLEIIGKAGTDDYLSELRTLAKRLDVDGDVIFVGPLKREDILKRLRTVELLLFPSRWEEAFGLVAIEAMTSGAIVIGSNRGAIPEVIGDAGFVVEPEAEAFAKAIQIVLTLPEDEKENLRLKGQQRVSALFNLQRNIEAIEIVLRGT
jgi:glycosyltransferase involved in cell wall biosynthesis